MSKRHKRRPQETPRSRQAAAAAESGAHAALASTPTEETAVAGPRAPAARHWPLALGLLVATLTVLVFLPCLRNGFVNWDDDFNILNNPDFRGLGWTQLKWMFTTFYLGPYQPLSWLTLGADYALWGLDPFGYHLTNLLLHGANAAVFFAVALAVLRRLTPEPETNDWRPPLAAAFASLAFSLHPLRVESVAWVTERRDVLSGLFYLLSVWSYLRGLSRAGWAERHAWALAFFACALMSKAIVISLPLVLIALDFYPLRRLPLEPGRWFQAQARPVWTEKIPYMLLALAAGAFGFIAQREVGATLSLQDWGLMPRISQAFYGLIFYLPKTLWPTGLYALYEAPQPILIWKWPYWACAGSVIAITGATVWTWRRWPAGLVLWVFYGVSLAPVLGLVKLGQAATADRYTYLACLGWALAAGAVLLRGLRCGRTGRSASIVLAALICGVLGFLSARQIAVWRNSESLWSNALRHNPKHIYAANNLGTALLEQGRTDEAIAQLLIAIRNHPVSAYAFYNLGNALAKKGVTDKAMAAYREALRWDGSYFQAHNNLAALLASQGQISEAEKHFRDAIRLRPAMAHAHLGLADILRDTGRTAEAISEYEQALLISPGLTEARNGLGIAWARQGRLPEAAASFRAAVAAQPADLGARVNLAAVLSDMGREDEAVAQFQAALRIDPSCAAAHNGWGTALARRGRIDEAIARYREALRLDPRLAEAHNNLGTMLLNQGRSEQAVSQYREALALRPDYPEAHFNLANVLARRGELGEAAGHYRETLRLSPGNEPARKNLDAILKHLSGSR